MTEWSYFQLVFTEENHVYQQCTSYAKKVNLDSGNLETHFKIFSFVVHRGNTS